nr:MAG TPA: hypothetical protein [Caudoviricetes sp.]
MLIHLLLYNSITFERHYYEYLSLHQHQTLNHYFCPKEASKQ